MVKRQLKPYWKKTISVTLDDSTINYYTSKATEFKVTRSSLIQMALVEYMKNRRESTHENI